MKSLSYLLMMVVAMASAQPEKYTKVPNGYLMVLRQGDSIFEQIESFAIAEKIPAANFTAMGFVNMTFGYFNFGTKEYEPKTFDKMELASMQGTIAWQNGKPSIHAHGVVTGKDFTAHGGHILNGTVDTGSLEVMIFIHDNKFERVKDEKLGANVLCLKNCQ